jgi:hypothetical protein
VRRAPLASTGRRERCARNWTGVCPSTIEGTIAAAAKAIKRAVEPDFIFADIFTRIS